MGMINEKVVCDMARGCTGHVTHIDEKGFVYCSPHGIQRKSSGRRCRKLKPFEMRFIHSGRALRSYRPEENKPVVPCSYCGILFAPYWLKEGKCNGCRNPHLVVTAVVES